MNANSWQNNGPIMARVGQLILLFIFSLATSQVVYEWVFPRWPWLARPIAILLFATVLTFVLYTILHRALHSLPALSLSPLLLNLISLFDPNVDLVHSRFLYFVSLWLTAVFIANHRRTPRLVPWFGLAFILIGLLPIYLLTMPASVGRADTFEFQVVIPQLGIAHPTGYPLYLLLAKLFTYIPFHSVAWRINLASVVFALAALTLIYLIILQLDYKPVPALLGATAIGLTPTFWSQAIEAEVYALHALIVAAALWTILALGSLRLGGLGQALSGGQRFMFLLAFVLGLGLTNHLTTVFLIPAAILASLFSLHKYGPLKAVCRLLFTEFWLLPKLLFVAITPLVLYLYLPLRWAAVNEDSMGFGRFVDWVIGGRFQGALQWSAWRNDPTRYEVIGRLFLDNWGIFNLILAGLGLLYLTRQRRREAILLALTWFGFTFYALNYYVPDISVFLIPAHMIIGIWWAAGMMGTIAVGNWLIRDYATAQLSRASLHPIFSSLLLVPLLLLTTTHWSQLDRSEDDGLTQWGMAVLKLPLAENAAILADSEKIAPLYYLQQADGLRPDLDIMVLPDEAAYRAELNGRIGQQTIYLARFLPGLEGTYHLRSVGPLTEVSPIPLTHYPESVTATNVNFGEIELVGYEFNEPFEPDTTAVTLYWRSNHPITRLQHIYLRWEDSQTATRGQHPANDDYPTIAWDVGEIVSDFHLLPNPIIRTAQTLGLQAAWAPPFAAPDQLNWQLVATVEVPPTEWLPGLQPLRMQIGPTALGGIRLPPTIRPQTPLVVTLTGFGDPQAVRYQLSLDGDLPSLSARSSLRSSLLSPFTTQITLDTDLANGRYALMAHANGGAVCGWGQSLTAGCILGDLEISGVPLPADATNYADKIALLPIELASHQLRPGEQFPLTLHWQSLATMDEDYTIFIQVVSEQDEIVGQVDAWPLQGTLPTSQWAVGRKITDPHRIQLRQDLPAGTYRLLIGWYLLADGRRLAVLDRNGNPIDDKLIIPDLFVP